jgi:hypothetical protein
MLSFVYLAPHDIGMDRNTGQHGCFIIRDSHRPIKIRGRSQPMGLATQEEPTGATDKPRRACPCENMGVSENSKPVSVDMVLSRARYYRTLSVAPEALRERLISSWTIHSRSTP